MCVIREHDIDIKIIIKNTKTLTKCFLLNHAEKEKNFSRVTRGDFCVVRDVSPIRVSNQDDYFSED